MTLDVRFEIFVDINLLIKRFLEVSFGGIKGFLFYSSTRISGWEVRCCRGNEQAWQGKVSGAFMIFFLKGLGLRTASVTSVIR